MGIRTKGMYFKAGFGRDSVKGDITMEIPRMVHKNCDAWSILMQT